MHTFIQIWDIAMAALAGYFFGKIRGMRESTLSWAPRKSFEAIYGRYPSGASQSYGDSMEELLDLYRSRYLSSVSTKLSLVKDDDAGN